MPAKPAFLFDLGGVLIDWNPRYLYRKAYGEAETEFFLANVCTGAWNLALDGGRSFDEAILEKQASWPEYRDAIGWWKSRWEEMLAGPIQETVDILEEIKDGGFEIHALTNWSAETFPMARERFGFLSWFRTIVVSGEVRLVKPDPEIYRVTALRCGFEPENTVFIDDSAVNVAAAKAFGFQAIRFTGAEDLRRTLQERGWLA
jgi:2-haloacid dehalogenase